MAGLRERFMDFFARRDAEQRVLYEEYQQLEDELRDLRNEARYQEEPAFEADRQRKRALLERDTRYLIFETREPHRSQLQGRCQMLVEEIERPEAVRVRLGEVQERLAELRDRSLGLDDADTVERDAAA